MISALDIVTARRRLTPFLQPTPLRHSPWLSAATGGQVYLKLESAQLTNSFKIRGAFNSVLRVLEQAREEHATPPLVVTASAGNHGRAMALACERLGMKSVVFTPSTAPETKKRAIRQHGVELRETRDYDEAEDAARTFAASRGALYISPYNHADVIAGAGTIGLEILDLLPRFDVLVVPIGGGGLASGLGVAIKAGAPKARVIGVETAASTPFAVGRRAGRIQTIEPSDSLADGLTGNLEPGSMTFDLVERFVDALETVNENEIAGAIRALAADEHVIAEGAGAVAAAAVMAKKVVNADQTAVVIVSGANIDIETLARIIAPRQP
jgi:threonine dehydratase